MTYSAPQAQRLFLQEDVNTTPTRPRPKASSSTALNANVVAEGQRVRVTVVVPGRFRITAWRRLAWSSSPTTVNHMAAVTWRRSCQADRAAVDVNASHEARESMLVKYAPAGSSPSFGQIHCRRRPPALTIEDVAPDVVVATPRMRWRVAA